MNKIIKICKHHGDLSENDCYIKGDIIRCRFCQRKWSKNNYNNNKEKILIRHSIYGIQYKKNNKDKFKQYNKKYWQKGSEECKDNYVKDHLKRNSNLKISEIPDYLVSIQRNIILIKRKIKEIKENENS